MLCESNLQHDICHDAGRVGGLHDLPDSRGNRRANRVIRIELGVGLQEVGIEGRLRVGGLDDQRRECPCVRSSWSSDSEYPSTACFVAE